MERYHYAHKSFDIQVHCSQLTPYERKLSDRQDTLRFECAQKSMSIDIREVMNSIWHNQFETSETN